MYDIHVRFKHPPTRGWVVADADDGGGGGETPGCRSVEFKKKCARARARRRRRPWMVMDDG